jgi:hypothetical protein
MKFPGIKVLAFSIPALLLMGASAVASADSITNGAFTTPGSSTTYGGGTVNWTGGQYGYEPTGFGWTFVGGVGVQQDGSPWGFSNAPNGAGQSAFMQSYTGSLASYPLVSTANPSTISQVLTGLTVGDQYTLSFYLEQRPGMGANPVTVSIDDLRGLDPTFAAVAPPDNDTWTLYSDTFIATNTSEALIFAVSYPDGGTPTDSDTGLAGVSLAQTPEPGTLMLLGTGLLALAGLGKQRLGKKNV